MPLAADAATDPKGSKQRKVNGGAPLPIENRFALLADAEKRKAAGHAATAGSSKLEGGNQQAEAHLTLMSAQAKDVSGVSTQQKPPPGVVIQQKPPPSVVTQQKPPSDVPQQKPSPVVTAPSDVPVLQKLPPFVVVNRTFSRLRELLYESNIQPVFKFTRFGIKVTCRTEAEYKMTEALLTEEKAEYYTHDRTDSRPFKVVLSGLPNAIPDSLKEAIKNETGLEPVNVYKMTRREEGAGRYKDTLYLVHFPKGSVTLKALQQVRAIDNIVVHWERYRTRKNDVTHCQKCLNFGHGTRNCHLSSRCNRCGDAHPTDECQQETSAAPRCANCQGQHHATDRSCPKRAEFLAIRKKASTNHQQRRQPPKFPEYAPDSFPNLGKNSAPSGANNHQQVPPPGFRTYAGVTSDPPPQDAPELFSTAELMTIFKEMTAVAFSYRSKHEQLNALADIVTKYGK